MIAFYFSVIAFCNEMLHHICFYNFLFDSSDLNFFEDIFYYLNALFYFQVVHLFHVLGGGWHLHLGAND
jgi:hypothetical protein